MAVIPVQSVDRIVETLLDYFGRDVERVLAFYNDIDPKFRGVRPEMDAIIDGIDGWLIANRWPGREDWANLTWEEMSKWSDEL